MSDREDLIDGKNTHTNDFSLLVWIIKGTLQHIDITSAFFTVLAPNPSLRQTLVKSKSSYFEKWAKTVLPGKAERHLTARVVKQGEVGSAFTTCPDKIIVATEANCISFSSIFMVFIFIKWKFYVWLWTLAFSAHKKKTHLRREKQIRCKS